MRLIDADRLILKVCGSCRIIDDNQCIDCGCFSFLEKKRIDNAPTVDAEPVVRCKDCVYYHKAHIERKDGTECDISEVPEEFIPVPGMCNSDYGINVGGKCEYDNIEMPYVEDKSVFRGENDFCSRGKKK